MSNGRKDDFAEELRLYPNTARFLEGRLRDQMSVDEKLQMEALIERTEWVDGPKRILERGNVYNHSTMLIEGFVLRTLDDDDKRYGVSFHVPGDFIDLHCFALKRLDHNIDAIGKVKIGIVPHAALTRTMETSPHLSRMLWFSTLLDAAMHREWIMKLEQLTTPKRLAHIFAEISHRLQMVHLTDGRGFDTDLRQTELSQMAGATTIHTNRALKQLRESEVAFFERGRVTIPDLQRLEEYAMFTPDYLYSEGDIAFQNDFGHDE